MVVIYIKSTHCFSMVVFHPRGRIHWKCQLQLRVGPLLSVCHPPTNSAEISCKVSGLFHPNGFVLGGGGNMYSCGLVEKGYQH